MEPGHGRLHSWHLLRHLQSCTVTLGRLNAPWWRSLMLAHSCRRLACLCHGFPLNPQRSRRNQNRMVCGVVFNEASVKSVYLEALIFFLFGHGPGMCTIMYCPKGTALESPFASGNEHQTSLQALSERPRWHSLSRHGKHVLRRRLLTKSFLEREVAGKSNRQLTPKPPCFIQSGPHCS